MPTYIENAKFESSAFYRNARFTFTIWTFIFILVSGSTLFGQSVSQKQKAVNLITQGDEFFEEEDYEQALNKYEAAIKEDPNSAYAYLGKGNALAKLKRDNEAVSAYETASRLDDTLYEAYLGIAQTSHNLKDFEKTLKAMNRVVELRPFSGLYVAKAILLFEMKRIDEGLVASLKAKELDNKNPEAYYWAGSFFRQKKEYKNAEFYLKQAISLNNNNQGYWLELGNLFFEERKWNETISAYQNALKIKPDLSFAYIDIGTAYANLNNPEAAINSYQEGIKQGYEGKVWTFWRIGMEYKKLNKIRENDAALNNALKLPVNNILDIQAKSRIYISRGELWDAVEWMQKAIDFQKDDDDTNFHIGLSWYYSFLGEHEAAEKSATKAIELNPEEAMGYTNRCRAYNDLEFYEKAKKDCETALKIDPTSGETLIYLARTYDQMGDNKMFIKLTRQAIPDLEEKAADNSLENQDDWLYLLGNAYYYLGQYDNAVQSYLKVIKIRSRFPQARSNLGMAYVKLLDKQAALLQYRELLNIGEIPKARKLKGEIDKIQPRTRKARRK